MWHRMARTSLRSGTTSDVTQSFRCTRSMAPIHRRWHAARFSPDLAGQLGLRIPACRGIWRRMLPRGLVLRRRNLSEEDDACRRGSGQRASPNARAWRGAGLSMWPSAIPCSSWYGPPGPRSADVVLRSRERCWIPRHCSSLSRGLKSPSTRGSPSTAPTSWSLGVMAMAYTVACELAERRDHGHD